MEHDRLKDESNGQRLARVHNAPGLTQKQLAARVDYSLGAIKSIEQGRRSLDRGQVILMFARALDCHPSELLGHPFTVPEHDRDGQVVNAAVAAIHRALLVHGRPPRVTDAEVQPST
jgi:transcriptional regulator with XRE-family HTH domain